MFSWSKSQFEQLAAEALELAKKGGASSAQLDVSESVGDNLSVRMGQLENVESHHDTSFSITVYRHGQRGCATCNHLSSDNLRRTVEAALELSRHTERDSYADIPEAAFLASNSPDLELFHPASFDVAAATAAALAMEQAGFAHHTSISNSEGAGWYGEHSHFVHANSHGFCQGFSDSTFGLWCALIASAGEQMQREDWQDAATRVQALAAAEDIGRIAAARAQARLGARKLGTRTAPVIFEAPLSGGLLGTLVAATSGAGLYQKTSFLTDSLHTEVFAPWVRIEERPHLPQALASSYFDNEGVATKDQALIDKGVLNTYFLDSYSARKLGMAPTGHSGGLGNVRFAHTTHPDMAALMRDIGTGLLVTELLGHGINYTTGDYSRGAVGFWFENGEIAYPVHEITIAGNLRQMYRDLCAACGDIVIRGNSQMGSVAIQHMTIAGN